MLALVPFALFYFYQAWIVLTWEMFLVGSWDPTFSDSSQERPPRLRWRLWTSAPSATSCPCRSSPAKNAIGSFSKTRKQTKKKKRRGREEGGGAVTNHVVEVFHVFPGGNFHAVGTQRAPVKLPGDDAGFVVATQVENQRKRGLFGTRRAPLLLEFEQHSGGHRSPSWSRLAAAKVLKAATYSVFVFFYLRLRWLLGWVNPIFSRPEISETVPNRPWPHQPHHDTTTPLGKETRTRLSWLALAKF